MCGAAHVLASRCTTYAHDARATQAGRLLCCAGRAVGHIRRRPANWREMGMLRIVAGLTLLALGTAVVQAQNTSVIKERQDLMKANAEALKAPGAMLKGDAPFDLAKVKDSLKT